MKLVALLPIALLLVQCGTSPRQEAAQPQPLTAATPASAAPLPPSKTAAPSAALVSVVFDLDALFGLTIDQLKAKLGKPSRDAEDNMDGSVRNCVYKQKSLLLIANYVVASRRVDILHFVDETGKIPYKKLLALGNADTTSTRYEVSPSAAPFTGKHISVAVVPIEDVQPDE